MVLLAILVFVSSGCVDFANASYVRSVGAGHLFRAVWWTVAQWTATIVGFLVALKVSCWLLPFEALGLATGTFMSMWLASRDPRRF